VQVGGEDCQDGRDWDEIVLLGIPKGDWDESQSTIYGMGATC
jgi:hypothetical protein